MTAEAVRNPLARLAPVVEVQHRGDRIHAQRVDVIHVEPEERAAGEEVAHLGAAVVENRAVPLGVESLARIGMLVEMRAVEVGEAVLVGRKMRRHPVQDHADPATVQVIDEIHEILRRAVARCRREVARDLVAPGAVERVLHDRHQLHVREAHFGHVIAERNAPARDRSASGCAPPGTRRQEPR